MQDNFIQITSTVYKLLDFFPEGEPLKNRAKDKVLAITENLVLFFGTNNCDKGKIQEQLLEDIDVLLSFLKLAKSFGWIDNMNYLIIDKEYEKIVSQIKCAWLSQAQEKVVFEKTIEKNQVSFTKETTRAVSFHVSDRQEKILEVIREKGKAQVSDFKAVLIDITKRTIRRDLDELLKNGKIVRVGEWNQVVYQIVDRTHLMS